MARRIRAQDWALAESVCAWSSIQVARVQTDQASGAKPACCPAWLRPLQMACTRGSVVVGMRRPLSFLASDGGDLGELSDADNSQEDSTGQRPGTAVEQAGDGQDQAEDHSAPSRAAVQIKQALTVDAPGNPEAVPAGHLASEPADLGEVVRDARAAEGDAHVVGQRQGLEVVGVGVGVHRALLARPVCVLTAPIVFQYWNTR